MAETRRGRQIPTVSKILPYTNTLGREAVELYNKTPKTAQEWQELLSYDIMAINEDGLWVHTKFGLAVPRRNGKNEVVIIREMYGLIELGEKIMHTAHRTSTSHSAWERLKTAISEAGYTEGVDFKSTKQMGLETIEWLHAPYGKINFRTRSAHGGLGEGYDLLVIDEAQEYTIDQESALKYVVSDSKNPQTIFTGTPPTTVSLGTVFTTFRENVLSEKKESTRGWAEWSVPYMADVQNKELWYETNPSLGLILTERKIEDEIGDDDVDFNIQRLGLWLLHNLKSAISEEEWNKLQIDKLPEFAKSIYAGVKYGKDGTNVALAVAVKTVNKKVFVEAIDCRPIRAGNDWIIDYLKAMRPTKVVIDGQNGQSILVDDMRENKVKNDLLPTVKDVISANAMFEKNVFEEVICHMDQPSLTQVIANCEKRTIGTNGGFGYRSIKEGADIALMDAVILANWAAMTTKEKRKSRISY